MLGIRSCPVNWPIGVDGDFQGRVSPGYPHGGAVHAAATTARRMVEVTRYCHGRSCACETVAGQALSMNRLKEDIELLDVAGDPFDLDTVLAGAS